MFGFEKKSKENGMKLQSLQAGSEIFCEGQIACLKLEKELNSKGFKTKAKCNAAGMWSVLIVETDKSSK